MTENITRINSVAYAIKWWILPFHIGLVLWDLYLRLCVRNVLLRMVGYGN